MILKQFYLPCLAHASYIVADEQSKTAAVIDPQRDIEQYLTFAAENALTIKHVFLTHLHADFVAGHLELRARAGAQINLGATAKAAYPFTPFHDGDTLDLGNVRLKILETPGHTRESISILVFDLSASPTVPHAVLTGDTLFIGDVGRPDLRAALGWSAADLGAMLFDSLRTKLLALPDSCLVYPAHGAGSLCGKSLSKETVSTLGQQRATNYALQPMTKDAFIHVVTADQPDAPAYFNYDAVLNTQEHPTLDQALVQEMNPLSLQTVLTLQTQGAQILDTRDPEEFAAAHLAGAINVGLGGQYATWVGTVLNPKLPIVIIAAAAHEKEAAIRLGRIGFDKIAGYLKDGMHSLDTRHDLTRSTPRLSAPFAAESLLSSEPPLAIDVRGPRERQQKHIADSLSIPLNHLTENLQTIPSNRPLLVYCAGGYRSSIAASLLQSRGFNEVSEIAGGIAAWQAANLPVESAPQAQPDIFLPIQSVTQSPERPAVLAPWVKSPNNPNVQSTPSEQDTLPEITLRIPGPWESPEELRAAIAATDSGYTVAQIVPGQADLCVLHQPSGQRFQLSAADPDDEIVELFADSGRMQDSEIDALRNHKVKIFVTGPGGSPEAARTFLALGAAFINAGALGIMVDNCGKCHGPRDWLDLAGDEKMGGMYWAFVSVTASADEVFSAGMHCLGYRDAELPDPIDRQTSGMMLHEFLGYTYQSGATIVDGDPIGGPNGPDFILRHVPCTRFPKDTPWHNPYGVWRLEKFEGEEDHDQN